MQDLAPFTTKTFSKGFKTPDSSSKNNNPLFSARSQAPLYNITPEREFTSA
jgi:hypothetical protein